MRFVKLLSVIQEASVMSEPEVPAKGVAVWSEMAVFQYSITDIYLG